MSWIVLALSLVFSGINIVFSTQMCPLIGVLSDRVELGAVQGYFGRGSRTAAQPHSSLSQESQELSGAGGHHLPQPR